MRRYCPDVIEVVAAPPESARDNQFADAVCDVINRAYHAAEGWLWQPGHSRTTVAESAAAIAEGEIVVAYLDGQLAGAVQVRLLDDRTGWLRPLSADPALSGRGIGSALVTFIEDRAATKGCSNMQLELLIPNPAHPHTDRVGGWYGRLRYAEIERRTLADFDPQLASYLTRQCDVSICQKDLAAGQSGAG